MYEMEATTVGSMEQRTIMAESAEMETIVME